ncbi:hypothetical protein C0995_011654, partial [Termitomyces sp. Mi166
MIQWMRAVTHSVLPARADYVQYVHLVDEVLLQRLEQAEQPVPAMVAFLQDDLAIIVVKGLLNQIELLRRQHVTALEQIEHVGKCKAPVFEKLMMEPKQARAPSQRPQELVWAPVHTVAQLPLRPMKLASVASTSRSICMDPMPTHQVQEPDIPAEPLAELSLTPEQYDGLIVTQQKAAAASKGKGKVVPTLLDESNYGESLSVHERESEEGESVAQCFQRVQYNKKLAAKKARKAKAEAALQHRAINDFSGRIPDGLGVKGMGAAQ